MRAEQHARRSNNGQPGPCQMGHVFCLLPWGAFLSSFALLGPGSLTSNAASFLIDTLDSNGDNLQQSDNQFRAVGTGVSEDEARAIQVRDTPERQAKVINELLLVGRHICQAVAKIQVRMNFMSSQVVGHVPRSLPRDVG